MRATFFTFLCLLFACVLQAQYTLKDRYRVYITPTQFFVNDYPVSVERCLGKNSIGLGLSYRPAKWRSGDVSYLATAGNEYNVDNFLNPLQSAATVSLFSRHYFSGNFGQFYAEGTIYYRYWWVARTYARYKNVESYSFDGTCVDKMDVGGVKLLLGIEKTIQFSKAFDGVLNMYCGAGLRYKSYTYELFNGYVGATEKTYTAYNKFSGNYFILTPQAGIKLGMGFKKKIKATK